MAEFAYTCIACHVVFQNQEEQRSHYKAEWHRYNLKRKVADLPPVTSDAFASRVLAQQIKDQKMVNNEVADHCETCNKKYASANAYLNHLNSKKHKEKVMKKGEKMDDDESVEQDHKVYCQDTKKEIEWANRYARATTEAEVQAVLEEKYNHAIRLTLSDCLFCACKSKDLEENIQHMSVIHSFFIPEIQYLKDLEGLFHYLAEKITVYNLCLYCNNKGKGFHTIEGVRKHMTDKGHCKIQYEDDADLEVSEFYDFTESYPTYDEDESAIVSEMYMTPDETELILPSGNRIGHRQYRRYYKQHLKPEEAREAVLINRLVGQYKALGWVDQCTTAASQRRVDRKKDKILLDWKTKLGIKTNRFQKHFREQIL